MKAWTGVPWKINLNIWFLKGGHCRPETAVLHKAQVWIIFPGLPVAFIRPDILYSFASRVGSPIQLDEHTAKLKKRSFARLCVEIDLQKSLTPGIFIGVTGEGFWQRFKNPCHLYALRAA